MAEKKPPKKEEIPRKEYYEKVRTESTEALVRAVPSIALYVATAVLIWLFGHLVFLPIAETLEWAWMGYPVKQILTFIILVALVALVLRILVDVRGAIDAVAGIAACEIGAPYDISPKEVGHYKTALRGIFYVIVVSLAFLLFAGFLADIHPGLPAIALIVIVVWAIYQIWTAFRAISEEFRRYASEWAKRIR